MGMNPADHGISSQDYNLNTRITGNTVSNPGEGLSENFEINTVGINNFSSWLFISNINKIY